MKIILLVLSAMLTGSLSMAETKPALSIVDKTCGNNLADNATSVAPTRVCHSKVLMTSAEVIRIEYSDGTQEVFPIMHRVQVPSTMEGKEMKEKLTTYTYGSYTEGGYLKLATKDFIITTFLDDAGSTSFSLPLIEGVVGRGSLLKARLSPQSQTR